MQTATIETTPRSSFPVQKATGYSIYASLLNTISQSNEVAAETIHDSPFSTLRNSGLEGHFTHTSLDHHKQIQPDKTYTLNISILHTNESQHFNAILNSLLYEDKPLELTHGKMDVVNMTKEQTTHKQLLETAAPYDTPSLSFKFITPTCIQDGEEITTPVPHREPVFTDLLYKWNQTAPDEYELDITTDEIKNNIYSSPNSHTLDTHSLLTNRYTDNDGETQIRFKQGFTGEVDYRFKDASPALTNALTALTLFAQHSGVGRAVARGCGTTETTINQ